MVAQTHITVYHKRGYSDRTTTIRVANFLARILERKAKRAGEKPLMTTFSVYNLARNNRFDSGKANRELGYTSRPYRETIRDEIMWLKSVGLT